MGHRAEAAVGAVWPVVDRQATLCDASCSSTALKEVFGTVPVGVRADRFKSTPVPVVTSESQDTPQ